MAEKVYDFSGKRILVTGAGKGIGRATCAAIAKHGGQVIALSRTQSDLDSLKEEVPGIISVCADVTQLEVVQAELEKLRPIHMLVNNAALGHVKAFTEITPEEYDRVMDVNLKAALFVGQYVVRDMLARGEGGAIVNISSQASQRALPAHTVYGISKAGIDMLTKMMALELGPQKIRVNAVNPTVVMTEMGRLGWSDPQKASSMLSRIPLRQFAEVSDVVDCIIFLLSDKSAMVSGATLPIDGGFWTC